MQINSRLPHKTLGGDKLYTDDKVYLIISQLKIIV